MLNRLNYHHTTFSSFGSFWQMPSENLCRLQIFEWSYGELNPDLSLAKAAFYPLNYSPFETSPKLHCVPEGTADSAEPS